MNGKKLSRRDFMRLSALTAAGTALAGCAPEVVKETVEVTREVEVPVEQTVEVEKEVVVTATPAAAEPVLLEIFADQPEYEAAEAQMWKVYEQQHPEVTVEVFSVNDDQEPAHNAKVAGGWYPAIGKITEGTVTKDNYQNYVNSLEIDFKWWDRWPYDVRNSFAEISGVEGFGHPGRVFGGSVFSWQYHKDLMEATGLDPRGDVKTWDDLNDFLEAGTAWAAANDDIARFWDAAFHPGAVHVQMQTLTMAFPEGQREAKRKCYLGEKAFNDADSPYRRMFESLKEWYDKGYMPENWWLREWEADMEASYIAKKSIMILHGPWVWEKALAADPSVVQEGIPATPPAEGQETWVNWMGDVATPDRFVLYKAVMEKPEWPHILSAWNWFYSPEAVKMRAEIQGSPTVYILDEPPDLSGGQWDGIVKEFYNDDGLYKDVVLENSATGELAATRFRKEGSPGAFAVGVGLAAKTGELMTGTITVQDMLDWIQNNWEQSYDI